MPRPESDMHLPIVERRLDRQLITRTGRRRPEDVVGWFGAVQAQDYGAAVWALGLRMTGGARREHVDAAFDAGRILRTHIMRPTWHFVAAGDIRWLLTLTAPRIHQAMAFQRRWLELDSRKLTRGTRIIARALEDDDALTRQELGQRLHRRGLPLSSQQLAHLVAYAELEGVICSGPRLAPRTAHPADRTPHRVRRTGLSYALLDRRAPARAAMSRDEALATIGERYFRSHGPATIRDFAWWSGLTVGDAKRSVDMIRARRKEVDRRTYWTARAAPPGRPRERLAELLPYFDEYLVAYRDREAVPHGPSSLLTFQQAIIVGGQTAATWRVTRQTGGRSIQISPIRRFTARERRALTDAVRRYEGFMSSPTTVSTRET